MFIRRKRGKRMGAAHGHNTYQVVETYRDGGKVKHRSIVSLGAFETPEAELKDLRRRRRRLEQAIKSAKDWAYTYGEYAKAPKWHGRRVADVPEYRERAARSEAEAEEGQRRLAALDEREVLLRVAIEGLKASKKA